MEQKGHKIKTIFLSALWLFSSTLLYTMSLLRRFSTAQMASESPGSVDWYGVFLVLVASIYLIPLLRRIRYHAVLAEMKGVAIISQVFTIIFAVLTPLAAVLVVITAFLV